MHKSVVSSLESPHYQGSIYFELNKQRQHLLSVLNYFGSSYPFFYLTLALIFLLHLHASLKSCLYSIVLIVWNFPLCMNGHIEKSCLTLKLVGLLCNSQKQSRVTFSSQPSLSHFPNYLLCVAQAWTLSTAWAFIRCHNTVTKDKWHLNAASPSVMK